MEISISNCTSILLSLPSKDPQENNCIIIIVLISSCFEIRWHRRMKQRNFLRKKKTKTEKKEGEGWEKGRLCDGCTGLSNDWKLGVRKARKFDSSFREGHNTWQFSWSKNSAFGRVAGRDTTAASKNDSKQYCHGARTRKDFNFWSFRWNERRMRERKWKKKGEKREEEYPSTLSLANSSFISFLPLFCALISFLFFSLFPSSSDLMHPTLVFNPWRKGGSAREGNYYPGGW